MMAPLGPDGINARIAEIQSKLASLSPKGPRPLTVSAAPSEFSSVLAPLCPTGSVTGAINPLSGAIGGPAVENGDLKAMAQSAAARYNLDPALFNALVEQESGWKTDAVSPVGAQGLCQLMPGTAAGLGVKDPFDPAQSLEGGARYLRQMMDRFGNDPAKALAAYNAGPGFVSRHSPADWPHETKGYVRNILANSGIAS